MTNRAANALKACRMYKNIGRYAALRYAVKHNCLGAYRLARQLKAMEDSNEITAR